MYVIWHPTRPKNQKTWFTKQRMKPARLAGLSLWKKGRRRRSIVMQPLDSYIPLQEVGKYRVNEEFVHHNNSFETASWWEDIAVSPGIYPIVVAKNHYDHRNPLCLRAICQGTVRADFFPSSFGGAMFGRCESRNIGAPRKVERRLDWEEAIQTTGSSPNKTAPDIFVDWKFWPLIEDYLRARMEEDIANLVAETRKLDRGPAGKKPDEGEVRSLKIVSHWAQETAQTLETLLHQMKNHQEEYFRRLHIANTQWAKEPCAAAA